MRNHSPQNGPDNARLRLLLAVGSSVIGSRFRAALQPLTFVEIVGEANRSEEALSLFFQLRPDVVVVSVLLSGQGGFEVLRCIKRADAESAVVLTTSVPNRFVEQTASMLGATGVCADSDGLLQLRHILESLWNRDSAAGSS